MAKRGMSAAMLTETGAQANHPCHLVEITAESGGTPTTTYMTNYYRKLSWGGNEYLAVGKFLDIGNIQESSSFQIHKLELLLSGVDTSTINLFLNNHFIDQPAKVHVAMVNASTGEVVDDPVLIFDGNIDAMAVQEDPDAGTAVIKGTASNLFVDFMRKSGRHTTDSEQQYHFSGDLFFQPKLNKAATKEWGK